MSQIGNVKFSEIVISNITLKVPNIEIEHLFSRAVLSKVVQNVTSKIENLVGRCIENTSKV